MSELIDEYRASCQKALTCLYIAVDREVADDVSFRVKSYISNLEERVALQGVEVRSYLEALGHAHDALNKIREICLESGIDAETEAQLLRVINEGLR